MKTGIIFIIICTIFIPIYFASNVDIWGYEKDLEKKIPFTKKESIIFGRYDKNIVSFETNYGTKINYDFPENTRLEDIAKFTKENVGQEVEIKIENIQSAYLTVFNMKVQ